MHGTNSITVKKILGFAAVVEIGTSLVLMIAPAFLVALLLGVVLSGEGIAVGRCFGITLLALGVACWPSGQRAEVSSTIVWAMLAYNALIALYLAHLSTFRHLGGVLLWAGVVVHAVVAVLLFSTWRNERLAK